MRVNVRICLDALTIFERNGMKYRKKPVVIEAIQFDGTVKGRDEIIEKLGFVGSECYQQSCFRLAIQTLEGSMSAYKGDWVIKGIKGELYPCKPDIFEMTYEVVE